MLTTEESTFYRALHDLHRRAGHPSLRTMDGAARASRATIHAVFTRPKGKHPTWGNVELIVEYLVACIPGADLAEEKLRFHQLWDAAELSRSAAVPSGTVPPPVASATVSQTAEPFELRASSVPSSQDAGQSQRIRVAAATKLLQQQLDWRLSASEQTALRKLARQAAANADGRMEVSAVVDLFFSSTPYQSAEVILEILRSLVCRGYVQTSPSGRLEITSEGKEAIIRVRNT